MKVAIFARVSTDAQSTARQISDLQTLCQTNGWTIAHTITEQASGAAAATQRAGVQELFDIAKRRQIKKVVITEVSRIGRNVSEAVQIIELLTTARVSLYIQNIGLETLLPDNRPNFMFKPILLTLVGFAEMERDLLRERIKSGQAQARRAGKEIGRPSGKA
ncbi:MAG: recombinase family protein, partial [Pirellulaceae bacterium]